MFTQFDWLALEVRAIEPALAWYTEVLALPVRERTAGSARLPVGDDGESLRLVEPGVGPRGGVHVHYALSIPPAAYDPWHDRLTAHGPVVEHDFGGLRSLYVDDPDGHCVELATAAEVDGGATGVAETFEIVLEVRDLEAAEARYAGLGATVTGRGADRRRVRLDAGAIDLELWEPRLGIADGRGGLHVTMAGRVPDPHAAVDPIRDRLAAVEPLPVDAGGDGGAAGVRLRDPDGHVLELRRD